MDWPVFDQTLDAGSFLFIRGIPHHRVEHRDVEAVAHRIVDGRCTCKMGTVIDTRGCEPIVKLIT